MEQAMRSETALVVEPSARLRELVAILLEETGYIVREIPSIEDVLPCMRDEANVRLLFIDAPARDLIDTARTISRKWPRVRLIVPCGSEEAADFLPNTALRMNSPWNALDVLIHAERARLSALH